jgi:hypothetical protein
MYIHQELGNIDEMTVAGQSLMLIDNVAFFPRWSDAPPLANRLYIRLNLYAPY